MSTTPTNLTQWLQQLPIPWLVSGPVGQADVTAYGTVLDGQVDLARQGVKARMPLIAPADALPHIGGDRGLIQGPSESNSNFAIRCQDAWGAWSRAGQPATMLEQLYWAGFPGAVLVQQNGIGYSLSGAPTAGADPTSLLTATTLGADPNISGTPPWWTLDTSDYFCSRFAVLFPGPTFPPSMTTYGTATFTASDSATVTWNNVFQDTTYKIQVGPATITDGSGPVLTYADNTTKTISGVQILASDSFTGTVDVLAYNVGANPLADFHPADLQRLRTIIARWRPAETTCVAIYALTEGRFWGWPLTTWGAASLLWGSSSSLTMNP